MIEKKKSNKKKKRKIVVGLDEAGRGSLIGPVVAAAVIIKNRKLLFEDYGKIQSLPFRDSKKLSCKRREQIYKIVTKSSSIEWGIGTVSCSVVDKINILEATKKAMINSLKSLGNKIDGKPSVVLIDGNFKINSGFKEKSIVKGDEKILACLIAGIIAKVYRDRIIKKYSLKLPFYGWEKNKGYGTKKHFAEIRKRGPCFFHRKSFNLHYP